MEIQEITLGSRPIIGIREQVTDPGEFFARALPALFAWATEHEAKIDGPPLGVYYHVDESGFDMAVALFVHGDVDPGEPLFSGHLPGGRAATYDYAGSYEGLSSAWAEFRHLLADAGLHPRGENWEEYHVGPESGKDTSRWRTRLVQPVR